MKNYNKKRWLFLLFPLMLFAVSGVVMWLWNALLPEIIGVKSITFWQAMGIFVLSKILFGGFRGGRCGKRFPKQKPENMTDNDREKFREMMKERFGAFCKK